MHDFRKKNARTSLLVIKTKSRNCALNLKSYYDGQTGFGQLTVAGSYWCRILLVCAKKNNNRKKTVVECEWKKKKNNKWQRKIRTGRDKKKNERRLKRDG